MTHDELREAHWQRVHEALERADDATADAEERSLRNATARLTQGPPSPEPENRSARPRASSAAANDNAAAWSAWVKNEIRATLNAEADELGKVIRQLLDEEEVVWRAAIKEAVDGLRAEMRQQMAFDLERGLDRLDQSLTRLEKLSRPAFLDGADEPLGKKPH